MSNSRLNINEESLHDIGNLDVINLLQHNSIRSCEFFGKDTLYEFLNELEFKQVLIEVMASPNFIEEWESMIKEKIINIEYLSKKLIRIECVLTKGELMVDKIINRLFFLASINDFVVIIVNPNEDKEYFNSKNQKVDVDIVSNEKIIWFEFDATDVYIVD